MAKNRNSGKEKQDQVISQFQKDIYQDRNRTWLTAVEQSILQGRKNAEYLAKRKETEQVRISFYNPDSPLRGSSSWSRSQWDTYKSEQRQLKRLAKQNQSK